MVVEQLSVCVGRGGGGGGGGGVSLILWWRGRPARRGSVLSIVRRDSRAQQRDIEGSYAMARVLRKRFVDIAYTLQRSPLPYSDHPTVSRKVGHPVALVSSAPQVTGGCGRDRRAARCTVTGAVGECSRRTEAQSVQLLTFAAMSTSPNLDHSRELSEAQPADDDDEPAWLSNAESFLGRLNDGSPHGHSPPTLPCDPEASVGGKTERLSLFGPLPIGVPEERKQEKRLKAAEKKRREEETEEDEDEDGDKDEAEEEQPRARGSKSKRRAGLNYMEAAGAPEMMGSHLDGVSWNTAAVLVLGLSGAALVAATLVSLAILAAAPSPPSPPLYHLMPPPPSPPPPP